MRDRECEWGRKREKGGGKEREGGRERGRDSKETGKRIVQSDDFTLSG